MTYHGCHDQSNTLLEITQIQKQQYMKIKFLNLK